MALPTSRIRISALPALAAVALTLLAGEAGAAEPAWKPILEARLRGEAFETPAASASLDERYDLLVGRLRAGGELTWQKRFTLRGIVQGAFAAGIPAHAAFGAGLTMFNTNLGDRSPEQVGIAELAFLWKEERLSLAVGRQGWSDGAGPATGVAHLDFVRTRRLAERLVGNLEFANVARRYDGVSFTGQPAGAGSFELFALRPLGGAHNYDQAFEPLDIEVGGVAWATPYGTWIPRSALRLFAQIYRDDRDLVTATLGDEIRITTFGGSLLTGGPSWDVLLWGAVQRGDFGRSSQRAWAMVSEVGYRFTATRGEPSIHLGWEQASGGGSAGESHNFWNGLPTNHKFYGALDYFAFSNLRDLFVETRWAATKSVALSGAIHDFCLVDRRGPWVSGSGAMSDRELGYSLRRPASGRYDSAALGRELDLAATWTIVKGAALKLEGGKFVGGAAAKQVLPVSADGSWLALEMSWTH